MYNNAYYNNKLTECTRMYSNVLKNTIDRIDRIDRNR